MVKHVNISDEFRDSKLTETQSFWNSYKSAANRICPVSQDPELYQRFSSSWQKRAAVCKPLLDAEEIYLDEMPDFLVELLPFHQHPLFQQASEADRYRALTCGWLAYNAKTIAIESKIISPACMHLIDGDIPGMDPQICEESVAQAMVDESFHILLTLNANRITQQYRNFPRLFLPQFQLVNQMQLEQSRHPEQWKKTLIQLAVAIVSEVMVSDYLKKMTDTEEVQPFNVLTTEIHRKDESAHNGLFKCLGKDILGQLSPTEQKFFLKLLTKPSEWFVNAEWDVWTAMLEQIHFPHAQQMIAECRDGERHQSLKINLSTLNSLFVELDLDPPRYN